MDFHPFIFQFLRIMKIKIFAKFTNSSFVVHQVWNIMAGNDKIAEILVPDSNTQNTFFFQSPHNDFVNFWRFCLKQFNDFIRIIEL